jgi:membrane fusion protein, heavy metal efflux system
MKVPFLNKSILCSLLFLLCNLTFSLAHGDEIPTDPGVAKDHFTAYGQSDKYEITLYYPELTAGQEAHLTLYLADYKTNKPIDKAVLQITTLENPAGSV